MLKMMEQKNQHRLELMGKTSLTLEEMADLHDLPRGEFLRLLGSRENLSADYLIDKIPYHAEWRLRLGDEKPHALRTYERTEYKEG
jgi:hypothetical protein